MLLNKIYFNTDQSLQLSLFMKILLTTKVEFINILPDQLWEDMLLKSLDGVMKTELIIGLL